MKEGVFFFCYTRRVCEKERAQRSRREGHLQAQGDSSEETEASPLAERLRTALRVVGTRVKDDPQAEEWRPQLQPWRTRLGQPVRYGMRRSPEEAQEGQDGG